MSQPTNPAERRSDWWCCRADYPGHETTCENFEERRTGERRGGTDRRAEWFGSLSRARRSGRPRYIMRTALDRRSRASDRRSPGGAGLADQSQARGSVGVGIIMGVGTGAAPHDVAQNVSCILSVCAACGGALDLRDHGWRERPGMLRIAVCRACEVDGTPLAEAASTPPHEQQNEPSSSPSRAPGDEPAPPFALPVRVEREVYVEPPFTDFDRYLVVDATRTFPFVRYVTKATADFIADCINARRAAPPSKENEKP